MLKLGYFDDFYSYVESAIPLSNDLETFVHFKSLIEMAIQTMAVAGPRSPRQHRRPSFENILPSESHSAANTPRTIAHIAEMPTKIQQLKAVVLEKIKEIENKDDSNTG